MVTGEEPGCLGAELERYAERARPCIPPPDFILAILGLSCLTRLTMIVATRRFHFMIWGLGPYLALCTILDCFTGLQLLYSYSLSVVPLRASVYHVFFKYFLASGRRLFDPIAAYPRHLHKIREVRRSVAVTVAASPAPPPPPC